LTSFLEVEMLPAGHGDALLVRYGDGAHEGRLLIDGGPSYTYKNLLARLLALPLDERRFEVLVVTHIDGDHIDGIIRLLQEDLTGLGISFDDVWFNGTEQMDQVLAADDALGENQGEYMQALIKHLGLPWNKAFGGGPVLARPSRPITLAAGGTVRVFSPTKEKLLSLLGRWNQIVAAEGFATGTTDDVLARLRTDKRLRALGEEPDALGGDKAAQSDKSPDSSLANGSSIAFTLEVGRRTVLFTGDAHVDVLKTTLDAYLTPGSQLRLDALKMPHHGSSGNWDASLLDRIECKNFLFSTNGSFFGHPDSGTIETVISEVDEAHLWFNYVTPQTIRWLDPDIGEDAIVHFPSGNTFR